MVPLHSLSTRGMIVQVGPEQASGFPLVCVNNLETGASAEATTPAVAKL